jgi:Chitin binding Peritrophin-A domain
LELEGINCKALSDILGIDLHTEHLYFPFEDNCNKFYHCGLAGASLKECGKGTIFSMKAKECRRPEDAKCVTIDKFFEKNNLYLDDFYSEEY